MEIIKQDCFYSSIYSFVEKKFLDELNKIADEYIDKNKDWNKKLLLKRNKKFSKDVKDFGFVYHSDTILNDTRLKDFLDLIMFVSSDILNNQGYDLTNYNLCLNNLWAQKASNSGGSYHNSHVHQDSHISGFYFLECSENTSFPVFHDPRVMKKLIDLPEKNEDNITEASNTIHYNINPGLFIFFPSYLMHEFTTNYGIDNFKFLHFSIQAIKKKHF